MQLIERVLVEWKEVKPQRRGASNRSMQFAEVFERLLYFFQLRQDRMGSI